MTKGEHMPVVHEQVFLAIGEGSIGPASRVASGEISERRVDQLESDIRTNRFYRHLPEGVYVPDECVDGRLGGLMGPNAAGGTFSVVMGFALSGGQLRKGNETAPRHAARVYEYLMERGHRVGGHDDEKAHGPNCGCGAQDKLDNQDPSQPSILGFIERRSDDVRSVLESLGIEVSDDLHAKITDGATSLRQEMYATTGADLRKAFVETSGEDSVSTLMGVHNEVVVVINTEEGTTLDRNALAEEYRDEYEAFNVDVWALKKTFDSMALSADESHENFVAALYYNVATASVLADSSLRVVVR